MGKRSIVSARALVTGASSGIGRDIALELARGGADVLLVARRRERLEGLAAEVRQLGRTAECVAGDITDAALRDELLQHIVGRWNALDILVNNAGIGAIGPFSAADPERLRRVMEVNFFAPVELTRAALPLLRRGRHPIIVNVASVLGHRAVPKKSEYCASKFALHGFSDALRAELVREHIDVLLVSPSTTDTEFFDSVIDKKGNLPWLRLGRAPSRRVARATVRAIERGRQEIILTPGGKLLVWLDRLSPPIINRLVARFG